MFCRQDNIVYGPDGLSAFSASYQPCGLGKLPSLDEAGRAYLGAQGVTSTKSGAVEHFKVPGLCDLVLRLIVQGRRWGRYRKM